MAMSAVTNHVSICMCASVAQSVSMLRLHASFYYRIHSHTMLVVLCMCVCIAGAVKWPADVDRNLDSLRELLQACEEAHGLVGAASSHDSSASTDAPAALVSNDHGHTANANPQGGDDDRPAKEDAPGSDDDRPAHEVAPSIDGAPTEEDLFVMAQSTEDMYDFEYTEQSNKYSREEVCRRKAENDISAMVGRRPRERMPDPNAPDAPDVFRGQKKRASGVYANRGGKKHQKRKQKMLEQASPLYKGDHHRDHHGDHHGACSSRQRS
jgi:hypothetical protein